MDRLDRLKGQLDDAQQAWADLIEKLPAEHITPDLLVAAQTFEGLIHTVRLIEKLEATEILADIQLINLGVHADMLSAEFRKLTLPLQGQYVPPLRKC